MKTCCEPPPQFRVKRVVRREEALELLAVHRHLHGRIGGRSVNHARHEALAPERLDLFAEHRSRFGHENQLFGHC
jgi:hypothetical protein